MEDREKIVNKYTEKTARTISGFGMLFLVIALFAWLIAGLILGILYCESHSSAGGAPVVGIIELVTAFAAMIVACFLLPGFHVLQPNEALVLTLFGKYYGTIKKDGFFWTNPFATGTSPDSRSGLVVSNNSVSFSGLSKKISLKTMTLNNEKQTVNDERGNPIIIGTIVIWRVTDTTKAVFNVQNYKTFLSTQCDSATRNIARMYPYDLMSDDAVGEKTLRSSSQEIADMMKQDLQERVAMAGLEILEVRITNLTYAPEIAAAMLQRQQAEAVVVARKKIVEGAVGMVEMALDQLNQDQVVQLDDERKAQMVSNLLVVLCGNKDAQPIVNSGSIY